LRRGLSLILALLLASVLWIATVFGASDASPVPTAPAADPSPSAEVIHGWPGARSEPAGLYSWRVRSGTGWIHHGSVELTFLAGAPTTAPPMLVSPAALQGWRDERRFGEATQVSEVRTELWLVDVESTRVAILLDSYPDTDPALLAEARAVIDSIIVLPTASGPRLVFRLPAGWDSG
jgi:hypothetical protein